MRPCLVVRDTSTLVMMDRWCLMMTEDSFLCDLSLKWTHYIHEFPCNHCTCSSICSISPWWVLMCFQWGMRPTAADRHQLQDHVSSADWIKRMLTPSCGLIILMWCLFIVCVDRLLWLCALLIIVLFTIISICFVLQKRKHRWVSSVSLFQSWKLNYDSYKTSLNMSLK